MKRTLLWVVVSLLTFGLGVATAFVWLGGRGHAIERVDVTAAPAEDFVVPTNMPVLAYCELANNPEKYHGKVVRVSGKLWYNMHGYFFLNKNCDGDLKQAAVIIRSIGIENKIRKDLGLAEYHPWEFPEIIAVGKFRHIPQPSRESDSGEDNSHLLFEVIEVEKASRP